MKVRVPRRIVRRTAASVVMQENREAEMVLKHIQEIFHLKEEELLTLQQLWHLTPKNQNYPPHQNLEKTTQRIELVLYYYFAGVVNGEIPNPLQVHEVHNELA